MSPAKHDRFAGARNRDVLMLDHGLAQRLALHVMLTRWDLERGYQGDERKQQERTEL